MTIEIRATCPDEHRVAANTVADALLFPRMSDDEWEKRRDTWEDTDSFSAWDGARCVGHASAFRFDTTVPGAARLKTAGVTRIGVLPTATRQGLLRSMMHELLAATRGAGAVLASLRASEAVIYGRFGFAVAGEAAALKITTRAAGPVREPAPGTMRLLAPDEILDVVPDLYDRVARRGVGTVSRPTSLWKRYFEDAVSAAKPAFVAVHANAAGELDGYVQYAVRWKDDGEEETGHGEVLDLFGANAAVERALWAYILDVDLILEWEAGERPLQDPLRFAVRDTRAVRLRVRWDEQWLRVLDVDAALRSRTYGPGARPAVVRVTDPLFADNSGTWRVDAGGAERTDAAPDLVVDIGALSAAYLGGTSWRELADAGRLGPHRVDAVDDADVLFASRPYPFCGSFF